MDMNDMWIIFIWMLHLAQLTLTEGDKYVNFAKDHDSLLERFGHYELIVPSLVNHRGDFLSFDLINSRKRTRRHLDSEPFADKNMHYKVEAYKTKFHMNLTLNTRLISPHYVVERQDKTGNVIHRHRFVDDCHYTGHLIGHERSRVAVSNCKGLHGLMRTANEEYFIEPLDKYSSTNMYSEGHPHIVYKRSSLPDSMNGHHHGHNHHGHTHQDQEEQKKQPSCSVSDSNDKNENEDKPWWMSNSDFAFAKEFDESRREGRNRHRSRRMSSVSSERNVETLIVAEKKVIDHHGDASIETYLLTIMNIVEDLYHDASIGNFINIVVSKMRLFMEEQDDITLNFHAGRSLDSFCQWQASINMPVNESNEFGLGRHDNAVLITRYDICHESNAPCQTIGLALLNSMCNPTRSCNINQDTGLPTAFTVAHEIGHNFGMKHDGDGNDCGTAGGIMAGTYTTRTDFYSWSPCSEGYITHFMDSGRGDCLNNDPHSTMVPVDNVRPGELVGGNQQCVYQMGEGYEACNFNHLCNELSCRRSGQTTCHGTSIPAAEGTRCHTNTVQNGWCYLMQCVEYSSRPQAVDGGWGPWQEESECSRECGGGISKSERHCDSPRPSHRGQYCTGERIRYSSCNKMDCLGDTADFHTIQCRRFNPDPYNGQYYEWRPLYQELMKPCELICVSNSGSHSRQVPQVEDGTRCYSEKYKPNVYDICISGVCKHVGCDKELGSTVTEDKCRICDGDGSTCETVTGAYDGPLPQATYQQIVSIPLGSTHIRVEENQMSNSYLALKSTADLYYINSDWYIEWPKSFDVASTTFKYLRPDDGPESLQGLGPTSEELIVMLLVQDSTSGVRYTFVRPVVRTSSEDTEAVFVWQTVPWSDCSQSCAGGESQAEVHCVRYDDHSVVSDAHCNSYTRPEVKTKQCNTQNCPAEWNIDPWSECTRSCGGGTRNRHVYCMIMVYPGAEEIVDESNCREYNKPAIRDTCGERECPPEWVAGNWSNCLPTCGVGKKTREVTCRRHSPQYIYPDTMCDRSKKPNAQARCSDNPDCPPPHWEHGIWSECSAKCGQGQRTRSVYCLSFGGDVLPDMYCDANLTPVKSQQCERNCVNVIISEGCIDDPSIQYCPLVKKFSFCANDYFNRICCLTCSELGELIL